MTSAGSACRCTPLARRRYLARLSGPLLDRVDVKVELLPVGRAELLADRQLAEPSALVAARATQARMRAVPRLAATPWRVNGEIPGSELRRRHRPAARALAPLERAMDLGQVSARGADRIIRMSWTLADLAGAGRPGPAEGGIALGRAWPAGTAVPGGNSALGTLRERQGRTGPRLCQGHDRLDITSRYPSGSAIVYPTDPNTDCGR